MAEDFTFAHVQGGFDEHIKLSIRNYEQLLQDVVDFLYGYGKYLNDLGIVFDELLPDSNEVANWATTSKPFMFWTTQNWEAGTVITLRPGAPKLKLITD